MSRLDDILDFWFSSLKDEADLPVEKAQIWFGKDEAVDRLIRESFESDLIEATAGKRDAWRETPQGSLALILVWDQFTRNIYRGTPQAFAQDPLALALSLSMQEQDWDLELFPVQRAFVYMPMEHSEDIEIQRRSVKSFEQLLDSAPPALEIPMGNYLEYAVRHYEIIERFGRFPHRNEILGRVSTAEEIAFLKEPGSSF